METLFLWLAAVWLVARARAPLPAPIPPSGSTEPPGGVIVDPDPLPLPPIPPSGGGGVVPPPTGAVSVFYRQLWDYATLNDATLDPKITHGTGELGPLSAMQLDAPIIGSRARRSIRVNFAKRTGSPNYCHDYTPAYLNPKYAQDVPEVWVRQEVQFSNPFQLIGNGCVLPPTVPGGPSIIISTPGYKTLFGRVRSGARFGITITPNHITMDYPGRTANTYWPIPSSVLLDGKPHVIWVHWRVGGNGTGLIAAKIEGFPQVYSKAVSTVLTTIYGAALGRNLNQGPDQAQFVRWGAHEAFVDNPGVGI